LIDTRPSDAGVYTCDMSNAVGNRRAEYSLQVNDVNEYSLEVTY